MSKIITRQVKGINYVVGEVTTLYLPTEFDGKIKVFRDKKELSSEIKQEFPGWEDSI